MTMTITERIVEAEAQPITKRVGLLCDLWHATHRAARTEAAAQAAADTTA